MKKNVFLTTLCFLVTLASNASYQLPKSFENLTYDQKWTAQAADVFLINYTSVRADIEVVGAYSDVYGRLKNGEYLSDVVSYDDAVGVLIKFQAQGYSLGGPLMYAHIYRDGILFTTVQIASTALYSVDVPVSPSGSFWDIQVRIDSTP